MVSAGCAKRRLMWAVFDASQGQNIGPGGVVRLCRSITLSDAVLATDSIFQPGNVVAKEFACQVAAIKPLSDDVFSVLLRLPAGTKGDFVAGQYLSINLPDADPAFFLLPASLIRGISSCMCKLRRCERAR